MDKLFDVTVLYCLCLTSMANCAASQSWHSVTSYLWLYTLHEVYISAPRSVYSSSRPTTRTSQPH